MSSDSRLYLSCLDMTRFVYEGKLLSTHRLPQRFDYKQNATMIRRAFTEGRIVDSHFSVLQGSSTEAVFTAHMRYERYYDSGNRGFGRSFVIHSRFTVVAAPDALGRTRIQRISEEPLTGAADVVLPSFALIAYLHSDQFEVRTTTRQARSTASLRLWSEQRFYDKHAQALQFYVRSAELASNDVLKGITASATMFDPEGRRVSNIEWLFP
jgi:hypothetical protein